MRITLIFIVLLVFGCHQKKKELTSAQVKEEYGEFNPEQLIIKRSVDISHTPINKKVVNHPEQYQYLNKVEIFSIVYQSDGLMVTGFLVEPKSQKDTLPVILYNRGGNQNYGQLLVAHAVDILAPLAAEGFVVAATNYRGNSGSEGKEQFGGEDVNDIFNLIDALGQIDKSDTSKVGLFGLSRGGMMSYLALKSDQNQKIKTVANIGGITDLAYTIKYHSEIGEVCEWLIPDFQQNSEAELIKRSAVHWVHQLRREVPLMILHGMGDQSVDFGQIPVFVDSLKKYEIPFLARAYEGDNHGLVQHKKEVMEMLKLWFKQNLKGKPYEIQDYQVVSQSSS